MSHHQKHHHHPPHQGNRRFKGTSAATTNMSTNKSKANPPSFICPLTCQIMADPVNCRCGHAFERQAIVSWLARGNPCCPISRKDLAWDDLVPNHILAERIEKWKWQKEHQDWMHLENINNINSGSNRDDNQDEYLEVDLEMDAIHSYPAAPSSSSSSKKQQLYAASQIYQAVPTGMMLLPQEQALQDSIRNRKEENRRKRRQVFICYTVLGLCLGITVVAFGLYLAQLLQQEKNAEQELEDGEV